MFLCRTIFVIATAIIALVAQAPVVSAQEQGGVKDVVSLSGDGKNARYHFAFDEIGQMKLGNENGHGLFEPEGAQIFYRRSYPAVARQLPNFGAGVAGRSPGSPVELNGTGLGVREGSVFVTRQIGRSLKLAVTGRWLNMKRMVMPEPKEQDDLHLSAFWSVADNTTVQADILSGTRLENDGTKRASDRIRLALKYDF